MMKLGWALALLSTSALAGCGSHSHAPVVYGTLPNAEPARIYNAPGQYQPARTAYAPQATTYSQPQYRGGVSPALASSSPAPLTPVTETWREDRRAYGAQPSYAAQPIYVAQASAPPANDYVQDLPGQVTVLPGDTVYAISRRTGASPQSIIALNNLPPPYALSVGQTIRVPASAVPPSHAAITQPAQARAVSAPLETAHVVQPGETLYSISRSTGSDLGQIAAANNLRAPYTISVGQTLRIPGASAPAARREAFAPQASDGVADIARTVSYQAPPPRTSNMFDWPVQGAIIGSYGLSVSGKRNDGVNIAAPVGTPVRAAADGEVVYRGSELDGYGNLILIKHEDGFVTAYAHNDAMLVKKGDRVRQGQVIAKVGQTGSASEPQLHFEIRQNLKSVDPVALLGSS